MDAGDRAAFWREKAELARARANEMPDGAARNVLLKVAEAYEELAAQAEKQARPLN